MPAERFFTEKPLSVGSELQLTGEEFIHLKRVMRKDVGDTLELVNGMGDLAFSRVDSLGKQHVTCVILEVKHESPPKNRLILAQGLPRINRLDDLIEKCTEIGVSEFWLFPGEKSEKTTLSENQRQRLKNLTISALKQCDRLYLPTISLHPPLFEWKKPAEILLYGDLTAKSSIIEMQAKIKGHDVIFVVGPEGGLSDNEEKVLQDLSAQGVSLNPHTLRTETAAIVASALLAEII